MNTDAYSARQADRDRQYATSFGSTEVRQWIESLTPAERRQAEAEGLLAPMLDRQGSTMRDEDAADLGVTEPAIPEMSESNWQEQEAPGETTAGEAMGTAGGAQGDERTWDVLRRLVGEILTAPNRSLTVECIAVVSGVSYRGDSMTEIAKRHGVSRAAVSKRCVDLTQKLSLLPSRAMKSLTARTSYRAAQLRVRASYET